METMKFGFRYFKKRMPMAILAEVFSFLGVFAELLMPLLAGMLIDFVIKRETVKDGSGGMFHFLLNGKFGQVHSMQIGRAHV